MQLPLRAVHCVQLAQEIADQLGVRVGRMSIKGYADGEIGIQVHENVRGKDVYLYAPLTCTHRLRECAARTVLFSHTSARGVCWFAHPVFSPRALPASTIS